MTENNRCPCGSGTPYAACCALVLTGQAPAVTALALMRSRYTAYVERNIAYLLRTWHPSTRPPVLDPATIPDWCGLEIVRTEQGREGDDEGVVEFVAMALMDQRLCPLREASRFVREAGSWFYVSGDTTGESKQGKGGTGKVGRNDPCSCGSGNKWKKCCGR